MELGIINIPNWILAILLLLIGLYVYLTWHSGFFKARGIPHREASPLVEGIARMRELTNKGIHESMLEDTNKYGKVHGVFDGRNPVYVITDLDILKQILVKQFPIFVGRRNFYLIGLLAHSVFFCKAKDWKRMRSLLTPAFTTSKIRQMETVINKNVDTMIRNLDRNIAEDKPVSNMKDYTGGFTMDVIASTAFGLDVDSQNNKDDPFVKFASKLLDVRIDSWVIYIALVMQPILPLLDAIGLNFYPKSYYQFFTDIVQKAVQHRKSENVKRVDLLSLMLTAQNQMEDQEVKDELQMAGLTAVREMKGLTEKELAANGMLVFSAGYDTTANTLAFLLHNLAVHPDVQEKVHDEITQAMAGHDSPNYDIVNKLPYLDMCTSETLRLFPIVPMIERLASEDITMNGIYFQKGMMVTIPIYALHRDPDVWPDPEKFDPERFTTEAKAARSQFSYMPFGLGPRQCLGMRLAQTEMRMAMVNLMRKFRFHPTSETQIPLKLRKVSVFTEPEQPITLRLERR